MPQVEWFIVMGIGGFFLVLGIALLTSGKRAARNYYDSLSSLSDARKFLERAPRPRFESLKIGGRISIAVGLVVLLVGAGFWIWG
ncbi:MAG: hypothetical protein PHU08_04160 [Dehalococcoidales bacterium]|nr:hypothetical protein [Dehalococcoidales bacterium]